MEKKHPKYVTSRCACCAAVTPHGVLRHALRRGPGRNDAILINHGGQYAEIDPFMFSIAVDELFRV